MVLIIKYQSFWFLFEFQKEIMYIKNYISTHFFGQSVYAQLIKSFEHDKIIQISDFITLGGLC